MVVNLVYMTKVYIPCYYNDILSILKKLKDQSQNAENIRSSEKTNSIYKTYINIVVPHGCHIYVKATDMATAKFVNIHIQIMHYPTVNEY